MKDLVKAADITEALRTIKVLSEKIAQLEADVNAWKINFDVDVCQTEKNEEFEVTITGIAGSAGLRKVVTEKELLYYTADSDTLVKELAKVFLNKLLGETVERALAPPLVTAIDNVTRLVSKRGAK